MLSERAAERISQVPEGPSTSVRATRAELVPKKRGTRKPKPRTRRELLDRLTQVLRFRDGRALAALDEATDPSIEQGSDEREEVVQMTTR